MTAFIAEKPFSAFISLAPSGRAKSGRPRQVCPRNKPPVCVCVRCPAVATATRGRLTPRDGIPTPRQVRLRRPPAPPRPADAARRPGARAVAAYKAGGGGARLLMDRCAPLPPVVRLSLLSAAARPATADARCGVDRRAGSAGRCVWGRRGGVGGGRGVFAEAPRWGSGAEVRARAKVRARAQVGVSRGGGWFAPCPRRHFPLTACRPAAGSSPNATEPQRHGATGQREPEAREVLSGPDYEEDEEYEEAVPVHQYIVDDLIRGESGPGVRRARLWRA